MLGSCLKPALRLLAVRFPLKTGFLSHFVDAASVLLVISGGEGERCVIKCKEGSHDAIQTHIILPRCHCLKQLGRSFPVARLGFKNSSKLVWSCRSAPYVWCSDPAFGNSCASPCLWLGWYFEGKLGLVFVFFPLFP